MASEKKKKNTFRSILGGEMLTDQFLVQQWKLMVWIVVLVIILISNDYACRKKMTQIELLKTELQDVQYENLDLRTQLTKVSRQSRLKELLIRNHIELTEAKIPAYEIKK
ncbi:hypothetical protein AGMMS49525_00410 [Bacteroidia bacterium]|nr:hypothetical protein AGMMS49525_00410 [Bacteroidia bacterium]